MRTRKKFSIFDVFVVVSGILMTVVASAFFVLFIIEELTGRIVFINTMEAIVFTAIMLFGFAVLLVAILLTTICALDDLLGSISKD